MLPVSGLATDAQTRNHAHNSQQQTPPSPTPRTAPTAGMDAEHRNAYTTPPSDSPPSASSPALSYTKYAASASTSHHHLPPYAAASNNNYHHHHHHRHASNNTRTSSSEYSLVESTTTPTAATMMNEPAALSFTRTMYNNNILSLDKSSMYARAVGGEGGEKGERGKKKPDDSSHVVAYIFLC